MKHSLLSAIAAALLLLLLCLPASALGAKEDRLLVIALEDGHYNIRFEVTNPDGSKEIYNGYCINYGDREAYKNQRFQTRCTEFAVNKVTEESVGHELKTLFVDYTDLALDDKIKTQQIIWHFTDDFNGWRVDPALMTEIRSRSASRESSNNAIPITAIRVKPKMAAAAISHLISMYSNLSRPRVRTSPFLRIRIFSVTGFPALPT